MAELQVIDLNLDESQEAALFREVSEQLRLALDDHLVLEQQGFSEFRKAYKAKPRHEVKNFPWPGASNICIPLVAITVDAIVARFMKTILGLTEYFQVTIKSVQWEPLEKDIRDWATHFIQVSGARDKLRTIFHDCALMGDAFCKPLWADETRTYHRWDAGQIVEVPVPVYSGVRWHVPAPEDMIAPMGFDDWQGLPWFAERQRFTWAELKRKESEGMLSDVNRIRNTGKKERADQRAKTIAAAKDIPDNVRQNLYEIYEVYGEWEIPPSEEAKLAAKTKGDEEPEPTFVECILTVSLDGECFLRAIENPWFGKTRPHVKIPYLVQAHELRAQGVGEQSLPFQEEVSTSHNQVIDAGTAANAAIIISAPNANFGNRPEVYPGKRIITDDPKNDIVVEHLGSDSSVLGMMEERGIKYNEVRTGVSAYHLGQESPTVGSQATATGTVALIGEGNLRFAVSIDDMRNAICNILYLTIQLEQQMRPEGYEWVPGRKIQFPQGDVRTSIGLNFAMTSDVLNKDVEIQQLQLLLQVVNDYYARVMQAAALIQNPMFPPLHKMMAIQVMEASQKIIKKFVERFDMENVDELVPDLLQTLTTAMGALSGIAKTGPAQVSPGPAGAGNPNPAPLPAAGAGEQQPSPAPSQLSI